MATIKDVASETGLSLSTISKYLNGLNVKEKNRIKIKQAIEKLNFTPNAMASGLRNSKSRLIGMMIPDVSNQFFAELLSGMSEALSRRGYGILFCDCKTNSETECIEFFIKKMVDGVVTIPNHPNLLYKELLKDSGTPCLMLDQKQDEFECDAVFSDNVKASYSAVEQFIKYGHRKIALICGSEFFSAEERLEGYKRALNDHGIGIRDDYIMKGSYNEENGFDSFMKLWRLSDRPTAILSANYFISLGLIKAIFELDLKIGVDISVITFDNMQVTSILNPPLSCVEQPIETICEIAADTITRRANGDYSDFPLIKQPRTRLIITNSVKKID